MTYFKISDGRNNQIFIEDIYKKFCKSSEFISKLDELLSLNKDISDKKLQNEKFKFYLKYSNQISLRRIAIPIFGKINSGKSTFLNYLLGLNDILQVTNDIATKFICFIRHNKNNEVAKFYEAIPVNRIISGVKSNYFNFEKGNEIKGNIHEIISQRNEEIVNIEKNPEIIRETSKFFIIIEANLKIFNDPLLEKYADIFEFLDIPGLDEGEMAKSPYFKDLIPIIMPNIAFSIFLFNCDTDQDESTATIVKKINMYFEKNGTSDEKNGVSRSLMEIYKNIDKNNTLNSLYIVNKVDKESESDEKKSILKEQLQKIFKSEKCYYDINKLNIISLSARNLLFEKNKFNDFYYFLGYTYVNYLKLDEKKRKEFKSYLSDELEKISKKEIIKEEDSSDSDNSEENDEDEYKDNFMHEYNNLPENDRIKIAELITKVKDISNDFNEYEYIKYKKKFQPKIIKDTKTNIMDELIKIMHTIMSRIVENFIRIDEFENLYQELKKDYNFNNSYILAKKIVQNYNYITDPIEIINEAEANYKEELLKMNMKSSNTILELTKVRKKIFEIQRDLYFLLFGISNSGKSTFINSVIIGEDILPTASSECTKIGVILQHCDHIELSSLYKVELKTFKYEAENKEYYYFDYNEENLITKGIENIKIKLIELNKLTKKDNIDFYLIKMPLKLYEFIDNEEIRKLRHVIHIIDFPGLDTTTMKEAKKVKSQLFKSIHGFMFLNRTEISTMNNNSTNELLQELLIDIRNRNTNEFSFKSCLFVMISEENKNAEDFRKVLNISINNSQGQFAFNELLTNHNLEVTNDDVQIIKFSNHKFRDYLKDYRSLVDENIFYGELKTKENEEELKNYYEKYLKTKIKLPKKFELPQEKGYLTEKILNNISKNISEKSRNKLSLKIAKYYYYIINNPTELICYKESGFSEMKNYLTKVFLHSNKFYQESLKQSAANYLFMVSKHFNEIKNALHSDENDIDIEYFENNKDVELNNLQKLIDKKGNKILREFEELKNEILKCLSSLYNNLSDKRKDFEIKEKKIIEEANRIYSYGKQKINNLFKIIYDNCETQLKNIKSHKSKKKAYNKKVDQKQLEDNDANLKTFVEDNFLEKAFTNPAVLVLNCIPVVNIFSYATVFLGGLIDHLRDHSDEYKKEIKRIQDAYEKQIDDECEKGNNEINSYLYEYRSKINYIFQINGPDLRKIKKNKAPLIKIINNLEQFLEQIVNQNN